MNQTLGTCFVADRAGLHRLYGDSLWRIGPAPLTCQRCVQLPAFGLHPHDSLSRLQAPALLGQAQLE